MAQTGGSSETGEAGAFAPLREPVFRSIWIASLFSNFGQLILGVAAAWEMTLLSSSPSMVALVQTALMLPLMLVALPAGAAADMFDRRKIAIAGLAFATVSSAVLTVIAMLGLMTPWILLAFCFLTGGGIALYGPAWMASVGEQVPPRVLPQAIALGSISYNVARSFGPAIGGLIVLALGAKAGFAINATFYIPLMLMYYLWKREHRPSRLPPERMDRAITAGVLYARHSVPIRTVIARALAFGFATAAIYALTPLVAKDLLNGNAGVYGILLGALGIGAVTGAMFVGRLRNKFSSEVNIRAGTIIITFALCIVGISRSLPATCMAIFAVGFCNTIALSMLNTAVQLAAPRWVTARALSLYTSALTGGMALGAWIWGEVATTWDVTTTFIASGVMAASTLLLALVLPLPSRSDDDETALAELDNLPRVAMDLTLRSGPIVVEVEYEVDPEQAREFHEVMTRMGRMRRRIGGFDWSISRDIVNPAIWIERYRCPTWGDYLRMRDRYSQADTALQELARSFDSTGEDGKVRRRLERPYGSVRWKAESFDPKVDGIGYV